VILSTIGLLSYKFSPEGEKNGKFINQNMLSPDRILLGPKSFPSYKYEQIHNQGELEHYF